MIINPHSARNFTDFVIDVNNHKPYCKNEKSNNFLYDLIKTDDSGKVLIEIKESLVLNQNGIILDGNIRYFLLKQLKDIFGRNLSLVKPIKTTVISTKPEDLYLYQLSRNLSNPLTLSSRFKAIKGYVNDYTTTNPNANVKAIRKHVKTTYGHTIYSYLLLLEKWEMIPGWLKIEGDKYDVNPRTLIDFAENLGTEKEWGKVIRSALHSSVNDFKITQKNIDEIKSLPKSENLLSQDIDLIGYTDEEIREQALEVFSQIQKKISSVTLKDYESKNWKKLLGILDEFLYILENV